MTSLARLGRLSPTLLACLGMSETNSVTYARDCTCAFDEELAAGVAVRHQRLRLVIFQEMPGLWVARGLEHDVIGEARSIGEAVRAAVRLIVAHTGFDIRHDHVPLSAFRPAPQNYWNAYAAGTPVSLQQLGIRAPAEWDICPVVTRRA